MSRHAFLVLIFALIASSFVLGTAVSEYNDSKIQHAAREIVLNASPSIDNLSQMRGSIRRLEVRFDDYVDGVVEAKIAGKAAPDSINRLLDEVRVTQSGIHSEWNSYRALETIRGETDLWPAVDLELSSLDDSVSRALEELEQRDDGAKARSIVNGSTKPAVERLDVALERIRQLNRRNSERLGEEIGALGHRSLFFSIGLDTLSVVITILLATYLISTIRRFEKLQAERTSELEFFAGRVAHDILSPLGSLSFSLSLIQRPDTSREKIDESAARGARGLERVRSLVDALLQFARAGARPEPGAHADIAEVTAGLIEELRPIADADSIDLRVIPFASFRVACSPGVLMSCIGNLVRNAVKYMGERSERRVSVHVVRLHDGRARIEVDDTGPGLPAGFEEKVFQPYMRGSQSDARSGIGLGLATVKRLVESHGGAVGVQSKPGHGCQFWFELPSAQPQG